MADVPELPRELERYLGETERVVLLQRRHWVAVAEPVLTAIGALALLGWLTSLFGGGGIVGNVLVVAFLLVLVRSAWELFDWRRDLFVVTNYRLINTFGIITRKVAMMPLGKVTDMSYIRSPWAKLLRYGTFRIESAGQDQALSRITYVKDPDATYRLITAQIFKPASRRATDLRPPPGSGSALPVVEPDDVWWRR